VSALASLHDELLEAGEKRTALEEERDYLDFDDKPLAIVAPDVDGEVLRQPRVVAEAETESREGSAKSSPPSPLTIQAA
jgi:hypothetical protein